MAEFVRGGNIAREKTKDEPFKLIIEHIATGKAVFFTPKMHALKLNGYNEDFGVGWSSEKAFGRMDDIPFYQGTTRAVSLDLKVGPLTPAMKPNTTEQKLANSINALAKYQYPVFVNDSIAKPPLLNVLFGNIMSMNRDGVNPLICYLTSFAIAPIISNNASDTYYPTYDTQAGTVYAKAYNLNLNFTILHDEQLGFDDDPPPEFEPPTNYVELPAAEEEALLQVPFLPGQTPG